MSNNPNPSPRLLITHLLLQLTAISKTPLPPDAAGNPLKARQYQLREVVTALEILLPDGVVKALDVLEKGLVARFGLVGEGQEGEGEGRYVYFVYDEPKKHRSSYRVLPTAWFCTCPAFCFAAFHGGEKEGEEEEGDVERMRETEGWVWGARMRGGRVPCCKHLLACVLVERCPALFAGYVKVVEGGVEEMAGVAVSGGRGVDGGWPVDS